MVELNLYVFVCCGSMSRHLGYAHCIDLHVLLVSVYIFLLCNKKLSYLPHSLDNTTWWQRWLLTMATVLQPPEAFDFKNPSQWNRWKRRFQQYLVASGLSAGAQVRQVTTLLYCLGDEGNDVLQTTGITDDEMKSYDTVVAKLDGFFAVRKNVIFDRARFNTRSQQPGESAEKFIADLYALAEDCNFGTLKEEMIRDRIVVGIRDVKLSQRLQMDSALDLAKAKTAVRQAEAVQEQHSTLNPPGAAVDFVRDSRGRGRRPSQNLPQKQRCIRCGRGRHPKANCPARNATCHNCRKEGHFASQCLSKRRGPHDKQVDSMQDSKPVPSQDAVQSDDDEYLTDEVYIDSVVDNREKCWTADLLVGQTEVKFKLDTGAEVTAISERTYKTLVNPSPLEPTSLALFGPGRAPLNIVGQFSSSLAYNGRTSQHIVFVIKSLQNNLLGFPAIVALEMAVRMDAIQTPESKSYHESIVSSYPSLFDGLGQLGDPYEIKLLPDSKPHALYTPRRVPLPLREKVKEELNRMESIGVISKVNEPSAWCAGMVAVPKPNGSVRICVDLRPLNLCVMRETFPLPTVDDVLAQLSGATIFSKLDANSGFWQVPLAPQSRHLTTFITHFGRYQFNKLPFGISSAPEVYQKRMSMLLEGLNGILCLIDDVLVFGHTEAEHDHRLKTVLGRIQSSGATLNVNKCAFRQTRIKFLGHIIDKNGVSADPDKTAAITRMPPPTNVTELRRFLGMVNQLSKFSFHLSELTYPLRQLLSVKNVWTWNPMLDKAFSAVKDALTKPTVLVTYSTAAETKVSADASCHSLGAVLLQRQQSSAPWKPVVYASRSLSEVEKRYAQIEKEALASTWACERFTDYILGKHVTIETDHKPLVSLLGSKQLIDLPPRILRFRLRLSRFDYSIEHTPGKQLHTADVLSRATPPLKEIERTAIDEVESFANTAVSSLPATPGALANFRTAQAKDQICSQVIEYCRGSWPNKRLITSSLRPYWEARNKISVVDDLLLYGTRIVVPFPLQASTIEKIHRGHLGIQKCLSRAQTSVWWPGYSQQIKNAVVNCEQCAALSTNPREPLIPSVLPQYPWQVVGADIFQLADARYLLVVDYYSRYPEVIKLTTTTSTAVVNILKSIFSRHGIPEILRSDNGPQFDSQEMSAFASSYGFQLKPSSPHYPQSNGQAERAIRTVKRLLKKSGDPHMALLIYRSTPLNWCGYSPAELLMGRRLRSNLPLVREQLAPSWPYLSEFRCKDQEYKRKQKLNYDSRHRVRSLPCLPDNSPVYIRTKDKQVTGKVTTSTPEPRSYTVVTPNGQVRRNRHHLVPVPVDEVPPVTTSQESDTDTQSATIPQRPTIRSPIMTRSKTGTHINAPQRLTF